MKKSMICLLLGLACASLCAAGTVYGVTAEENAAVTPEEAGLKMTAGASVRIADSKELTGIRWAVTMPADTYNALESSAEYTEVSYGILIAPYAYHKATPLTAASVFGAGGEKVYGWADADGVYEESYTQIINLETEQLYTSETDAENVHFYGSIVDILEKNLAGDFIGIGYIGYTTAEGGTSYVFAAENDNARSAAYVAQKAIEDTSEIAPSEEQKDWLQTNYVDAVKDVETSVTVRHVVTGENGEETEIAEDTILHFGIDSIINSSDCAEEIPGYVYDAERDKDYKVYASGKTIVTVYYNEDFAIENGGFETGDLTGWMYQEGTGNGQILGSKAVISDPTWWNERIPYNQGGNYHFDGWAAKGGEGEADTYTLKSSTFTLGGSGWISFKMAGNAAAVKVYKADGTQIAYYKNTAFANVSFPNINEGCRLATMTTFAADLSDYLGEELYIELCDETAAGWAVAFFDDIVTYYETAPDYANRYDTVQFYKGGYADGKEAINYDIKWVLAVNACKIC